MSLDMIGLAIAQLYATIRARAHTPENTLLKQKLICQTNIGANIKLLSIPLCIRTIL